MYAHVSVQRKVETMKAMILFVTVLMLAALACGQPAPEYILRGWTVTPSPTANAEPSQTPIVIQETVVVIEQITNTPEPTGEPIALCVSAQETVHLRPSPNTDGYPITVLENGARVNDLGGRSGQWLYVSVEDKQGWINGAYLGNCG
jgi:uncharacterized lipoprotein YajG